MIAFSTIWRTALALLLAMGLMITLSGYCPMRAAGGKDSCGAPTHACCQHCGGSKSTSSKHAGCCMMACCAPIGTLPQSQPYQMYFAPGDVHAACTIPQLESWGIGAVFHPPRA